MSITQVSVEIVAPPTKRDEEVRVLRSQQGRLHAERSCVSSELYQQVNNKNSLRLLETWDDVPSLERYLRSTFFGEVLVVMELSTAPPVISFETITTSVGVEYLAALRGSAAPP